MRCGLHIGSIPLSDRPGSAARAISSSAFGDPKIGRAYAARVGDAASHSFFKEACGSLHTADLCVATMRKFEASCRKI
jgi:hypothetical protein